MKKLSNEDKDLFAQALDGVTEITHKQVVSPKINYRKPVKLHSKSFLSETNLAGFNSPSSQLVSCHESLLFQQPGVRKQDMERLRKGKFKIEIAEDLHGMTEIEAEKSIHNFILEASQYACRFGLLVHGKGYNSATEQPIIKNLVNHQLRQYPQILAFCSASQKDGGTGAVYIYFAKKPSII